MSCPNTDNGKQYSVIVDCSEPGLINVTINGDPVDAEVTNVGGGRVDVVVDAEDVNPIGAIIRVYCGTTEVACATIV